MMSSTVYEIADCVCCESDLDIGGFHIVKYSEEVFYYCVPCWQVCRNSPGPYCLTKEVAA